MDGVIDYWDGSLLMFPFLQWVTHWHHFLDTNYNVEEQGDIHLLCARIKRSLSKPDELYHHFQTEDSMINFLTKL